MDSETINDGKVRRLANLTPFPKGVSGNLNGVAGRGAPTKLPFPRQWTLIAPTFS